MSLIGDLCAEKWKQERPMIRLYWRHFIAAVLLLTILVIFPIAFCVARYIDRFQIEAADVEAKKTEDRIKSARTQLQAEYLSARLREMMRDMQVEPKGIIPTASAPLVSDMISINAQRFDRQYRDWCKGVRVVLLDDLPLTERNELTASQYDAPFSFEMLAVISAELERLSHLVPVKVQ